MEATAEIQLMLDQYATLKKQLRHIKKMQEVTPSIFQCLRNLEETLENGVK